MKNYLPFLLPDPVSGSAKADMYRKEPPPGTGAGSFSKNTAQEARTEL